MFLLICVTYGQEIVDETDRYESNRTKRAAKRRSTAAIMCGCAHYALCAELWLITFE